MRNWLVSCGLLGAIWMILVLHGGSLSLARLSNYLGVYAAPWVHYRGIAPSSTTVLAFNVWLVFTSSIEWIVVGLLLRLIGRRLLTEKRRRN